LFTTVDEYLFQLFIVFVIYFRPLDAEISDTSIILRPAAFGCCAS